MLEALIALSKEALVNKWRVLIKTEPPKSAKKELLIKHIAWHLQAKKYGGHSAQTIKQLDKLATKLKNKSEICAADIKTSSRQIIEIKAGTKLIREYQGEKHEVTALDKGFEYKSRKYKSLSAIANEITGSRWNGKVFFGLKKA